MQETKHMRYSENCCEYTAEHGLLELGFCCDIKNFMVDGDLC